MIPVEQLVAGAESHRKRNGKPLVTISYAQSLDGSITAERGKPLALSGSASQEMTHHLRAVHDAILVGIGTILADDPLLSVRLVEGQNPQPVVLDSLLRFPLEAKLLQRKEKLPWIAATDHAEADRQAALEKEGARIFRFPPEANGHVPLSLLLKRLADEGINSLMVEGGAGVIEAFFSARLVDQAVITIAPIFVGGLQAFKFEGKDFKHRSSFPHIMPIHVDTLGEDIIVWGRIGPSKEG
jgi:riboflavin-specific deaminase-like protein